ncbi:MAG TPA: PDZ domain-containing protein [Firmicutes bacterium]|nr:PDZ domain-containing protein [Bacillota bacterium]
MFPFGKIAFSMLMIIPTIVLNPMFWVVVVLVSAQYSRINHIRERMLGSAAASPMRLTAVAALYGFAGGIIGSFIFIFIGVTINGAGLAYIWPLALLLMFIEPRFLCFSYAGGLVALSNLIFGFPDVSIPELMSLIAVLHMVESILIWVSGHEGAVPVFVKDIKGRLLGGFSLQKFWPIPIIAMMVMMPDMARFRDLFRNAIHMPEWWPLIKPGITPPPGKELIYLMFAIPAALGYGDIALARMPLDRSKATAKHLMLFSVALLMLAVASAKYSFLRFLAALFSPIGHEAVINIGRRMEFQGDPLFVKPEKGLKILDVVPGSAADRVGLRTGDIILSVNGEETNSKSDLMRILQSEPPHLYIEGISPEPGGRARTFTKTMLGNIEVLGIISVPEPGEPFYIDLNHVTPLKRFLRWLRGDV